MAAVSNTKVAIIGAGRVGFCLAEMLAEAGGYDVVAADCTDEAQQGLQARGIASLGVDVSRPEQLDLALAGADIAVAAVPDRLVARVAKAAARAGIHYLDFCEAGEDTRAIARDLPPRKAFLTGCGVSPGLVDAIAVDFAGRLDAGCDIDIRVGALPATRTNRLGYGLIWNLEGLIDEYTARCAAIVDGCPTTLPALSGRIEFTARGVDYEAFLTAGSIDALASLVAPRVKNLHFRTIRYPGHLDYMQFLLDDLGLRSRRDLLGTVLRNGLPKAEPDALVVEVRATGTRDGRPAAELFSHRIEPQPTAGGHGALALASAAHAATLLGMLRDGTLPQTAQRSAALVRHETVLAARFFEPFRLQSGSAQPDPR
jgi:saccharopine dehydrogenase-like NADP-dependent oxidoreductase